MIDYLYDNGKKGCLLKWCWTTLYLWAGTASSCHRSGTLPLQKGDLQNFHNLPGRIKQRKQMLKKIWPGNGCEYCKNIEDAGGMSDRLKQYADVKSGNLRENSFIPKELSENVKAVSVTPTVVEAYFSNRCNMSCIYCTPTLSSKWVAELKKRNLALPEWEEYDKDYPDRVKEFFQWLRLNFKSLRQFNILGGEPFFQQEFFDCLDVINELPPNPECRLTVFTNLKVSKKKLDIALERLQSLKNNRQVKDILIVCSLDCWGKEQEYVRVGLDLQQWEENYNYLVDQSWLSTNVNATMNVLSIKTMEELIYKVGDAKQRNKNTWISFNQLVAPKFMDAAIMPENFFDKDFDKISFAMEKVLGKNSQLEHLKGIQKNINNRLCDTNQIKDLKEYLDKMDSWYGSDWKSTFPWLTKVNSA